MEQEQKGEYELMRDRNIAAFRAAFIARFGENPWATDLKKITKYTAPKRKYRPKVKLPATRWSARLRFMKRRSFNQEDDPDFQHNYDIIFNSINKGQPHEKLSSDESDSDYENEGFKGFKELFIGFGKAPKRSRFGTNTMPRISLGPNRKILSPDDITEEHIKNISYRSAQKAYDCMYGTTCHQCRQKTLDTKSICRSESCVGVRGQFCGFCLKSRYGEDVAIVLKDAKWVCPPCRNICNCSICRTRLGKAPTGILAPQAINNGYESVHHFLNSHAKDV